jgi:hypothetical protein
MASADVSRWTVRPSRLNPADREQPGGETTQELPDGRHFPENCGFGRTLLISVPP